MNTPWYLLKSSGASVASVASVAYDTLGALYCRQHSYRAAEWLRVVGRTATMVRFQPVPTITTHNKDISGGGTSVVDMDWLTNNPVSEVKNIKSFLLRKVVIEGGGRGYINSKDGCGGFCQSDDPERPIQFCEY